MKHWLCGLFGHPLFGNTILVRKALRPAGYIKYSVACKCGERNGQFKSEIVTLGIDIPKFREDFAQATPDALVEVHRRMGIDGVGNWANAA